MAFFRYLIFVFLFFLFTVSGCAVNPIKYEPPHEGATSKIYFINNSTDTISLTFFEESRNCKRRRFTDPIPPKGDTSHIVRADEEFTFTYHLLTEDAKKYCRVNLRFTPISGKEYLFETLMSDQISCKWQMHEIENNRPAKDIIFEEIADKLALDENGSFCNR